MSGEAESLLEELYRREWGRIVATLIRLLGDFDLAEESVQEAFAAAVVQWREAGVPEYPRAWIIETARHKAIDRLRRQTRFAEKMESFVSEGNIPVAELPRFETDQIPDDQLRLIFTCCHPALAKEAQVALTLRTLCGLETGEIARAFLVPETTMAQRLVRAKRKIREARIPYAVPETREMPSRLDAVLAVLYLVFNEGYLATSGSVPVRHDLCGEAIRLARLLRALVSRPAPTGEVAGLLALMLLHDARREARYNESGDIVLLDEQDHARWNREQIAEAIPLVQEALKDGAGPYALQAAIAAVHCQAERPESTDWKQIVEFYSRLESLQPSPVVMLNRAVAVGMAEGPEVALQIMDKISTSAELQEYHLLHAARADMLRRLGKREEAASCYRRALQLVKNESEKRFLERRIQEVTPGEDDDLR